ncbi:methyltransferase family protein [Actinoalloteichus hymeniacidonis]|uniref:Methyltransferase family protein n=1 Tax=Actinoalloteichus hymeniacidonis TaxID=340345 RepID=A0AAC9MY36_9PSEU|nr:methyltransferase family protein [Actinoalloteichus hymeniacidonis]
MRRLGRCVDHGTVQDYWNHNTAYHRWILDIAAEHGEPDVLDVGCGDGLLLQRLAPHCATATGLEPHAPTFDRARTRLASTPNVTLRPTGFAEFEPDSERFDLVILVAVLHHLDLAESLAKARRLLRPGGDLLVVGLSANKTPVDWLLSGLAVPLVRIGSRRNHETRDIGVPVADVHENLAEIRSVARRLLPGVRIRRALYYRYLLRWTAPSGGVS